MNTSNDIIPRDPVATEPASAAPDDQALADIMTTGRAEPVEPGLLPTPRRPLGWLIGAGVVVVVGAVVAAVALAPKAPEPVPVVTPEPSVSASSTPGTLPPGAQLIRVTFMPADGSTPTPITSTFTVSPVTDGSTPAPIVVQGTLNPDGTSTSYPVDVTTDGSTLSPVMVQGTLNPDGTGTYTVTATTDGAVAKIWFLNDDGTTWLTCGFPSGATAPVTINVAVGEDGTVTCSP